MQVKQLLEDRAKEFSQKPAVIFKDSPISFLELRDNVFRLANALRVQGVKKSDKVAIYLPNCPEYVYSYLACFCLGAVAVPLDYMLKTEEIISCLSHCEAKYMITLKKEEVSLEDVRKGVPSLDKVILYYCADQNCVSYEKIVTEASVTFEGVTVHETDPALILYTSGTTGRPKGILLNYKHLEGTPTAMKHFVDLTSKDVKLCALPLSHSGGLVYLQNCLVFGITLILMDRFNPIEFLRNIQAYKVTCFHIVPPMYTALLTLKGIENFDLSSLRWIVVFGAPSSPEILRRFHQYCPNAKFLNGWGMTETCPPNTVTPMDSDRIESVGKPSPVSEIKIFDENDKEMPVGQIGEIVIRGWIVMQEYYKDPETTKEMKRNGWFHTGDLGRFDEEGFLYIVGRKKEMIKVGGQIVYAPEVEVALHKHEGVAEVAVIGIPDQLRGEAVKAFIVLKEKDSLKPEDLRYFAREHLAHFKVPQEIVVKDVLPRNRAGKIDKELLKKEG